MTDFNLKFQINLLDMNQKSCHCTSTHTFKGTSDLSESSPLASYWQLVDRFSPEKGWRVLWHVTLWCPEAPLSPIYLLLTFPFKEWMLFFNTLHRQSPSNHLSLTGLRSSFSFPLLPPGKAPEEIMCCSEQQQSCGQESSESKSRERRWAKHKQWKT